MGESHKEKLITHISSQIPITVVCPFYFWVLLNVGENYSFFWFSNTLICTVKTNTDMQQVQ